MLLPITEVDGLGTRRDESSPATGDLSEEGGASCLEGGEIDRLGDVAGPVAGEPTRSGAIVIGGESASPTSWLELNGEIPRASEEEISGGPE